MHLNVGVYGYTGAGKTTCIATLLRHLSEAGQLARPNKVTERFIESAAIGAADPTEKAISGLAFESDGALNAGKLRFTLRDLPGLELARAADAVINGREPEAFEEQLASCNAFLFFFNPIPPSGMDAQAHRERESLRARAMIDYVVSNRENRYLPIVFVITMRDLWGDNIDFCNLVDRWQDDVHRELDRAYALGLGQHYPVNLTDTQDCFCRVDGNSTEDVTLAFERVVRLRRWANDFVAGDKKRVMNVVIGAIIMLSVMIGGVTALAFAGGGDGGIPSELEVPSSAEIQAMREPELIERLNATDALLAKAQATNPYGSSFATAREQAEVLSDALRWMPMKQAFIAQQDSQSASEDQSDEDEDPVIISEETDLRLAKTHGRIAEFVRELVADVDQGSPRQRLQIAKIYLDQIDRANKLSPSLAQALDAFAALSRAALADELGEMLRSARNASQSVENTYINLRDRLGEALGSAQANDRLAGVESWQLYLEELSTAASFCAERVQDGAWELSVRLERAEVLKTAPGAMNEEFRLWLGPVADNMDDLARTLRVERKGQNRTGTAYTLSMRSQDDPAGPRNRFWMDQVTPVRMLPLMEHRKSSDRTILSEWQLAWHKQELAPAQIAIPGLPGLTREDLAEDGSGFSFQITLEERGGYQLDLELSGEYMIPELLWDARAAANSQ